MTEGVRSSSAREWCAPSNAANGVELTARDVMRPLDRLRTVTPDTAVSEALTAMAHDDVNQLPVVDHGRLEGIVSRGQIIRLLQARSELGV